PIRQGVRNVQYGKSFEQTKRDYSSFSERSDFLCAHVGNELIGLLKIVYRGEIASILNLLGKASHYDKRPGNVLMAKAVELCESQGISHLTYGLFNYGNKRESPLREFKIRNGFGEILVPRLLGLLTKMPGQWAQSQMLQMVEAIRHEPFYTTGTWVDESLGVAVGWAARKNSFCDGMPVCNESGDVVLVFSGEEFPEPGMA